MKAILFISIIALLVLCCQCTFPNSLSQSQREELLDNLQVSLTKAMIYTNKNLKKEPIDTLYGVALGKMFLNEIRTPFALNFRRIMDRYLRKANSYQRRHHPRQSKNFRWVFNIPLIKDGTFSEGKPFKQTQESRNIPTFLERQSDRCIANQARKCTYNKKCQETVFPSGTYLKGYKMTHAMLYNYYMHYSCMQKVEKYNRLSKSHQMKAKSYQMRANRALLHMNRMIATLKTQLSSKKPFSDELLEMHLIPMVLGDSTTLNYKLLQSLIGLQQYSGCWDETDQSMDDIIYNNNQMRSMLDYPSQDGCSYHMTGLAIAVLSNGIRVLSM